MTPPPFELDPRIVQSSAPLARLALCEVRLQLDARWPWLVLVPRRAVLTEVEHLAPADRATLTEEAVLAGRAVRGIADALGRKFARVSLGGIRRPGRGRSGAPETPAPMIRRF